MNNTALLPPHVALLVSTIVQANPFHANQLEKTLAMLESKEFQHLEEYLIFCIKQGQSIDYLARCYETIMASVVRESIYFKKHKHYRYSRFDEVANSVYYNDEYMSLYMHGVLITLFFWPNHLKLYRFFRSTIPREKKGNYLEIGPGHGYFFLTAVELTQYDKFLGIDISDTSINQTKKLLEMKSHCANVQLHCADFFKFPFKELNFAAIVMGEVLEHVENPEFFLKKIASIANKNTYIFITTCFNAPIIDHIYQFNDLKQIEDLFFHCGLRIQQQCILPYYDKNLQECMEQMLTVNVGYVLEKIV